MSDADLGMYRQPSRTGKYVAPGKTYIEVLITQEQKERLEAWKERTGIPVSAIVRTLVAEALGAERDLTGTLV